LRTADRIVETMTFTRVTFPDTCQ